MKKEIVDMFLVIIIEYDTKALLVNFTKYLNKKKICI